MNKELVTERLENARSDLDYAADEIADLVSAIDDAIASVENEDSTDEELREALEDVVARFHAESEAVRGVLETALDEVEAAVDS